MAKNGLRHRHRENRSGDGSLKKGLARWGLTLFISCWMFALGVLVGRGTVPVQFDIPEIRNKIQDKLAALKKEDQETLIKRMESGASSGHSGLPEPSDLYFHERLKDNQSHPEIDFTPIVPSPDDLQPFIEEEIAEGNSAVKRKAEGNSAVQGKAEGNSVVQGKAEGNSAVQGESIEDGLSEAWDRSRDRDDPGEDPQGPVENKRPLMKKPAHISREIQRPSGNERERVSAKQAPVSPKPADVSGTVPVTASPSSAARGNRGRYTLQVASFKLTEEAKNMIAHLQEKGYRAESIRALIHGKGIWHRVQVGAFSSKSDAQKTLDRLKKEGFAPIIVGRDE